MTKPLASVAPHVCAKAPLVEDHPDPVRLGGYPQQEQAQFHRPRARRGARKAIGAVAASILTAAYHMLKTGTFYQDLGPNHSQRRSKPSQVQRLVQKLSNFGDEATVKPLADAGDASQISF
jgi:hypothetical protein